MNVLAAFSLNAKNICGYAQYFVVDCNMVDGIDANDSVFPGRILYCS